MKIFLCLIYFIVCNVTVASPNTLISSDELFTQAINHSGALSPDGKYFSYLTNEQKYQYLLFVDLDSHQVLTALEVSEKTPITSYFWVSQDALWVTFLQDNTEVYYLVNTRRLEKDGEVSIKSKYHEIDTGYIVDVLIDEPKSVLFSRVKQYADGIEQTLYYITLEQLRTGDFENALEVEEERDDVLSYSVDESYRRLIAMFFDEDDGSIYGKFRELKGEEWMPLFSSNDHEEDIKPVAFIDNTSLAVLTNKDSDKIGLYRFDISTGQIKEALYVHDQYDLTDAKLTDEGNVLAVSYIENGQPRVEWLESFSQKITARFGKTFEGDSPLIIASNLSGSRLLILVHGANNPGHYYVYKREEDVLLRLLSLYPDLEKYTYPTHNIIKVKAENDTVIEAYLTKPKGFDHNTLIVMPHGGPIGVRDYNLFSADVQYLANRGFTVLRINFRGSEGFGKKFKDQGRGEFGKQIEADISLVVDQVLSGNKFNHVCAMGSSYGAYSSIMLSLKHPELYECVIASYGVYDLPLLLNYSNLRSGEEYEESWARILGDNTLDKKDFSPLYLAQNINVPVLLIAGKKDQIAGFEQSNRMRYVLKKLNKDVEPLFYNSAGHGHHNWYGDRHEYAYVVEFLIKTLNLPPVKIEELSADNIKAITYDYTVLADGFNNKNLTKNRDVSLAYTRLASEFGEGRLTFNLGAYYHRGDGVEKDIAEAIKYYKKAAEQGEFSAYARLGLIYLKGLDVERNDELAFKYFTLALEHEPSNIHKQLMARFYCVAGEKFKSVEKCISLFKKQEKSVSRVHKEDIVSLKDNLSLALIENTFTEAEHKAYKQLLVDIMKITHPDFYFDLEYASFVYYEENEIYGRSGDYIKFEFADLPLFSQKIEDENAFIRLVYNVDHSGFDDRDEHTFSVTHWQEFSAEGKKVRSAWKRRKASAKEEWTSHFYLTKEALGHTYKVTVYDAAGYIKFEKNFSRTNTAYQER